jgi:hypothetical protein
MKIQLVQQDIGKQLGKDQDTVWLIKVKTATEEKVAYPFFGRPCYGKIGDTLAMSHAAFTNESDALGAYNAINGYLKNELKETGLVIKEEEL